MSLAGGTEGNRIIITVLGKDKVGIIAGVAQVLSENNINILDISQTILQEYLVMILIADIRESTATLSELKERLVVRGKEIGVRIDAQHEDIFNFMHRI
ncbi:MAG TPA: ACT domain-containing protein [Clostridia bacterium]|nr:ACT domain-containing protein [Clostridia bacterium]